MKESRNYILKLNNKEYNNSGILRKYLKNLYGTEHEKITCISYAGMKKIIDGTTKTIKTKTLKSIVKESGQGLDINLPLPVIEEINKLETDSKYEEAVKKIVSMERNDFLIKFLEVYMPMFERKFIHEESFLLEMLQSDTKKFLNFIKDEEDYEMMNLIVYLFEEMPLVYEARRKLTKEFLSVIDNNIIDFYELYKNTDNETRVLFDIFSRSYSRYSIVDWKTDLYPLKELEEFINRFNLDKNLAIIAYNAISEENQEKFSDAVNNYK